MANEKGFWVLSQLGKKVLRPGGKEFTKELIDSANLSKNNTIVELAPGKGLTTDLLLQKEPKNYYGVDIEIETINNLKKRFSEKNCNFILASAASTGLDSHIAELVIGEAMLTMQIDHRKAEIIQEAARILKKDGLYIIHELGLIPNDIDENFKKEILVNLSKAGKVNARPLTSVEWKELLENNGFEILKILQSPMKLLEPKRLIDDEGFLGVIRILINLIRKPKARTTVFQMKKIFGQYQENLVAIGIVARKK
ncbi:MAG: class I SAM-dependent methyltransferase [Bacteroidetes bacterium]|nr:class I SAM-dependent methyltransferase [Bacteroidota bacterium]